MIKKTFLISLTVAIGLVCGCTENTVKQEIPFEQSLMVAKFTAKPVTVDGKLDEPCWKTAEVYTTDLSLDKLAKEQTLNEGGKVMLAWDDKYLYVAVDFEDSDVLAEGTEDGLHHYKMGDLAEVFIKPADKTWYWELYCTPRGNQTTFFIPSKGRFPLPSNFSYKFKGEPMKVAAQVNGTFDDYSDRDKGWTGEFAIPISELTSRGEVFTPYSDWTIFVGRYNYSYYLEGAELSMTPSLGATSYHRTDEYAKLVLEK